MDKFYSFSLLKRAFIGFLAAIVGGFVVSIVVNVIAALVSGLPVNTFAMQLQTALVTLQNPGLIQYMLFLQSFSLFFVPAIILLFAYSRTPFHDIGVFRKIPERFLLIFLISFFLFLPAINVFSYVNTSIVNLFVSDDSFATQMLEQSERLINAILVGNTYADLMLHIFFLAVIPAVTEELFFRGMLQTYFMKAFKSHHKAIILAAALFSILHGDIFNFLPRFIMGVVFGYAFVWTRSIWVPIIVHFFNNSLVVIVRYYINTGSLPENAETFGQNDNYMLLGIVSIAIGVFIFRKAFLQYEQKS